MRVVRLEDGRVDLDAERVLRGATSHKLTTLEAKLLSYLIDRGGDVSRQELQAEVWGYAAQVRTRAIDNTIRRLRGKIEREPNDPRHILTVHGVGYRFAAATTDDAQQQPPPESSMRSATTNVASERGAALVGRDRELIELSQAFDGGARLVTLVGVAGVGKTTLARCHGANRGEQTHTLFCDLSTARSQDELEEIVAHRLGVALSGTREEAQRRLIAAMDRHDFLLICDNFEQLLKHAQATVATWLGAAADVRVLVTSREPLGLVGERVIELEPLPEAEAAELFRQRARAVRQDLSLDATIVNEIVSRLDRIPLALELAATHVGVMAPLELLERMRNPLAGMQAALDTSWQTLSRDEQRALSCCSVFRGSFSLSAAEAVIVDDDGHVGAIDVVELLDSLRQKSLLAARIQYGVMRFQLLLSVRAWAKTKLQAGGNRERAERAHARFYLDELFLGGDHDLEQLAAEYANLVAIRERFIGDQRAVQAIMALNPLWYARGPSHVQIDALDEAIAASPDPTLRVRALLARAEAWGALGDVQAAEEDARRAEEHSGDGPLAALARLARGNIWRRQARYDAARAAYADALACATDGRTRAHVLRRIAACDTEQGDMPASQRRYREAVELYRAAHDERGAAAVLGMQGNIYSERGQHAQAERCFQAAIAIQRRLGNRRRLAIVLSNLAVVQHERGILDVARQSWQQSLAIHQQVVNRRFEAFALGGLGVLDHEEGLLDRARLRLSAALGLCQEIGEQRWEQISAARLACTSEDSSTIRRVLSEVAEVDQGAISILLGFADLADALRAKGSRSSALVTSATDAARLRLHAAPSDTSFQRISARLLGAAIARQASS